MDETALAWYVDCEFLIHFHNKIPTGNTGFAFHVPYTISPRQYVSKIQASFDGKLGHDCDLNPYLSSEQKILEKKSLLYYRVYFQTKSILYDDNCSHWFISPPAQRFLADERGIEIRHPSILTLANKIRGGNAITIVKKAYEIIRQTIQYRLQKYEFGAVYAVLSGEGDCTEFASLLVALLRIHGIGSRLAIGYILPANQGEPVLHAVAEIYLNNQWIAVDATLPRFILGLPYHFLTIQLTNRIHNNVAGVQCTFPYPESQWPNIKQKTRFYPRQKVIVLDACLNCRRKKKKYIWEIENMDNPENLR